MICDPEFPTGARTYPYIKTGHILQIRVLIRGAPDLGNDVFPERSEIADPFQNYSQGRLTQATQPICKLKI